MTPEALAKKLGKAMGASRTVAVNVGGYLNVTINWDKPKPATAYLNLFEDHIEWGNLSRLDLMETAHDAVREALFPNGINYLICAPADGKARKALLKNGDWHDVETDTGPMLRWDKPDGD